MTRRGKLLAAVLGLAVLGAAAVYAVRTGLGPLPDPEGCVATAPDGSAVSLSTEQAQNASIIAAVAVRRGLPTKAVSIAMAAAIQESKLRNLGGGDRDSLGLFQQRPSQGWGTRQQIRDPYYATNAFYDALVKVPGYLRLPITRAAQSVQRSAYPDAYAAHAPVARAVAAALTGLAKADFSCVVHTQHLSAQRRAGDGLTPRERGVRRDLVTAFGPLAISPPATGGPANHSPTRLRVALAGTSAVDVRRARTVARYLVANARRLHLQSVALGGRIWSMGSASEQGWQPDPKTAGPPRYLYVAVL